jgi:hypothetical protein
MEALALGVALADAPSASDGVAVDVNDEMPEMRGEALVDVDALGQPDALGRIVEETVWVGTSVNAVVGETVDEAAADGEAGVLSEGRPDGVAVDTEDAAAEPDGTADPVPIIETEATAGEALETGLRDALD